MILLLSWFYVTYPTLSLAATTLTADVHQVIRRKSVDFARFVLFFSFFDENLKLVPSHQQKASFGLTIVVEVVSWSM